MKHWDKLLFVLGVLMAVFAYGVIVGKYEIFPFEQLNSAKDAVNALKQEIDPEDDPTFDSPRDRGGVTRWERGAAYDGVTFIAMQRDGGMLGLLVDMEGKELHRWRLAFSEVWPKAEQLVSQGPDERFIWHGMHLFPNGDLLVNFEAGGFPAGAGLVLMDRDSKVRWKLPVNSHHDLQVLPDGRIMVAAHVYNREGIAACQPFFKPPYMEDLLLTVSPDGKLLDRVSVLEALCDSPARVKLMSQGGYNTTFSPRRRAEDPLHLNNLEPVLPEMAGQWPMAKPGDVLVSLRNLSMVGFIDGQTHKMGWTMTGPFVRQHDPDLMPNGHILVFDNLGGKGGPGGRSRILEMDPATQRIAWEYAGTAEDPFDSGKGGTQQPLPNGNVLVAEAWGGRVFEVTRGTPPRIAWEYVNLVEKREKGGVVGAVLTAFRFRRDELPFIAAAP